MTQSAQMLLMLRANVNYPSEGEASALFKVAQVVR